MLIHMYNTVDCRCEVSFAQLHNYEAELFLSLIWPKHSQLLMKPGGSLLCSQECAIGACPEADEASPRPHIYFPKIHQYQIDFVQSL
jgi:hypothetical protein